MLKSKIFFNDSVLISLNQLTSLVKLQDDFEQASGSFS